MNPMIKLSMAGLFGCMLAALGAGARSLDLSTAPAPGGAVQPTLQDVDKGIADLAREDDAQRKALAQQFGDKRKALVESDEWRGLSRVERRTRLRGLQEDLKEREGRLKDLYRERREKLVRQRQGLEDAIQGPETPGLIQE